MISTLDLMLRVPRLCGNARSMQSQSSRSRYAKIAFACSVLASTFLLAGCAIPPSLPPKQSLPVNAILRQTVCELRAAFINIDKRNKAKYGDKGDQKPRFDASKWAVGITLTPKVQTEASLRAGLTGKSSTTNTFFNSWLLGAAPGAQVDLKGQRDGSIKYTVHSVQLLDEGKFPLKCDKEPTSYHILTQNFAIEEWLKRVTDDSEADLIGLTEYDGPTYNTNVTVLFDGSGSFTYNFPLGTDFLGAYGKYSDDETLSIALAKDSGVPQTYTTLPSGGVFPGVKGPTFTSTVVSPDAQLKLNQLQFEQLLRNLNTNVGRTR